MKNNTTKSIILAPFNSTMSDKTVIMSPLSELGLDADDQSRLVFRRRCREANRQYEFNNNGQLDNGVYHKQLVQNSFEKESSDKEESEQGIVIE